MFLISESRLKAKGVYCQALYIHFWNDLLFFDRKQKIHWKPRLTNAFKGYYHFSFKKIVGELWLTLFIIWNNQYCGGYGSIINNNKIKKIEI